MLKILLLMIPSLIWAANPYEWNGVYVGGVVGGFFNQTSLNANHVALSNWSGECNRSNPFNSAFMGPQAGLLYPLNSKMVIGLEGDFTYYFSQSSNSNCICDTHSQIYDQFNLSNQNQGSIRGRLGYAMNNHLLPYFTAGGSFANLGISYSNEVVQNSFRRQQIEPGVVLGGGFEWAFSTSWSLRLEYDYYQYAQLTLKIPQIYGLDDPFGQATYQLKANSVRGVISYWI